MSSVDVTNRQVKSADRVRDLGEVFTPQNTVQEMLNLLPERIWKVHPTSTFLEPSCGDGNFLIAILDRKLHKISEEYEMGRLVAGNSDLAAQFHALQALSSIYAVDISKDNIIGGRPGHEIGARARMLDVFTEWLDFEFSLKPEAFPDLIQSAEWIIEHNILVGNMLPLDADGKATRRNDLPIIQYDFDPTEKTVGIARTTLGDIEEAARTEIGDDLMLFGASEPTKIWSGSAFELFEAEKTSAPKFSGPLRNGPKRVQL